MLGVPVRNINLRDPNVFQREQGDPACDVEALAFREAVRFERNGFQAEIRGNGRYLVLELKAALNTGAWSVNEPDQITLTRPTQDPPAGAHVFGSRGVLFPKAIEIIQLESFQSLLKELDMSSGESLNFYRNAVIYYARSSDVAKFLGHTNEICRFVAKLTGSERMKSRKPALPRPFADLNDCAQKWAIRDDMERAKALKSASVEDLKALVERVAPRLSSINAYLDTHSSEADAALGSLAEAVAEAQIALHQSIEPARRPPSSA